jgi:hypothetical protein
MDDTGVVCWGDDFFEVPQEVLDVPALDNPQKLSAGEGHNCALDNSGIVCWGQQGITSTTVPTNLNAIADVTANSGYVDAGTAFVDDNSFTCALDNSGVLCWGEGAPTGRLLAQSPPVQDQCDYSDADQYDGWGWNPVTRASCPPQFDNKQDSSTEQSTEAELCDYSNADQNGGWGWNASQNRSCAPQAIASPGDCIDTGIIGDGWG